MPSITVITAEGRRIQAEDAMDALRQLRAGSLIAEPDAWRFMLRVASRASRSTGRIVRSDSPARFLADMAAVGLLEVYGLEAADAAGRAGLSSRGAGAAPPLRGQRLDGSPEPEVPEA